MIKTILLTLAVAALGATSLIAGPGNDMQSRAAAVNGMSPVGEYSARSARSQTTVALFKSGQKCDKNASTAKCEQASHRKTRH